MDLSNQVIFQMIQTATLIVAVFVAWVSINKQRETTKKDKTISLLMKDLEDDFLKHGMEILLRIHNNNDDVAIYANSAHANDNEAIAIRNLLNYYGDLCINMNNHQNAIFHQITNFLKTPLALLGVDLKNFQFNKICHFANHPYLCKGLIMKTSVLV